MAKPNPGQTSKRAPQGTPPRGKRVRPIDPATNEPGDLPPDDWTDEPTPGEADWQAPDVEWEEEDLDEDLELDRPVEDRGEGKG